MGLLLTILLTTVLPRDPSAALDTEVIGAVGTRVIKPGESLIEIAREQDLGFNAIAAANPELDAFVPTPGATATIPSAWILPRAAAPGTVVVNLSEMRLYAFPLGPGVPVTYPVGIGSEGWETPLGTFNVVKKTVNPAWYPPASIRREEPDLPAVVPPGPDNPLGTHALRLSKYTILIHGTDAPYGVGRKASHGCVRLYPEDIPHLYGIIPVKTPVTIVREPVKVGLKRGRIFLEVHEDPDAKIDNVREARRLLAQRDLTDRVDPEKVDAAIRAHLGFPVDVSIDAAGVVRAAAPVTSAAAHSER